MAQLPASLDPVGPPPHLLYLQHLQLFAFHAMPWTPEPALPAGRTTWHPVTGDVAPESGGIAPSRVSARSPHQKLQYILFASEVSFYTSISVYILCVYL